MSKLLRLSAALVVPMLLCTSIAATAAKPKPKAKPKPAITNHATLGTTQLKGEYADLGSTYTLGKESPMNITLKSAEYSVDTLVIGGSVYYPKVDEKLLVLHINFHNPQHQETFARYDTFSITAVDAKNENHEHIGDAGIENSASKDSFSMTMKPAQKVDIYTAIVVPAKGDVPKVIFKSGDNLVLRYDLKGKVKALPAPYADPSDSTGATALNTVPAKIGDAYPLGELSVKVESTSFRDKPLPDKEMGEGNHYLVLNLTVKNLTPTQQFLRGDSLTLAIQDVDGAKTQPEWDMFLASRDVAFGDNIQPGQEMHGRYIFEVPKDLAMKTLTITREGDRTYEYDMSGVK